VHIRRHGFFDFELGGRRFVFATQPGVFSQDGPDEGTRLLLNVLAERVKPHMTVLDLGTGVGIIGITLAPSLTRGDVWMVDSDVRATRLTEENVRRNGIGNAHVVLGDITLDLPPRLRFDLVASNPPTHSGKDVLRAFVEESHHVLRPGGSLYFVVNRLLSVQEMLAEMFGNVEQVERRKGFIVMQSRKERRTAPSHPPDSRAAPE
jgi:16S rRNA (guanine1207-N2)-methyltransferase